MTRVNVGDLVRMKDNMYDSPLVGVALEKSFKGINNQILIHWFTDGNPIDWEPENWLEVVSEGR